MESVQYSICSDILLEYRTHIKDCADGGNVFLNHTVDHLLSKKCITLDHKHYVDAAGGPRERVGRMLELVSKGGRFAFNTLCQALACNYDIS